MLTTAADVMDEAIARLNTPVAQLLPTDTLLGMLERRADTARRAFEHAVEYHAQAIEDELYTTEVEEFEVAVWLSSLQAHRDEAQAALTDARRELGAGA